MPLLSRIPFLGGLFGSQELKNDRTELVLFITPRVVENELDIRGARSTTCGARWTTWTPLIPFIRPIIGPVFPGTAVNPYLAPFTTPPVVTPAPPPAPAPPPIARLAGHHPATGQHARRKHVLVRSFSLPARAWRRRARLTLGADFYILPRCVAAAVGGFRLTVSQSRAAKQGSPRIGSFRVEFPVLAFFGPCRVAISRHACRVLATLGLIGAGGLRDDPGNRRAPAAAPTTSPEAKQALVTAARHVALGLLIKDDLDAAYEYMSPGSSEATSLDKFKAKSAADAFREAKIETASPATATRASCRLYVTYDHPKMKGITTPVVESWIIDGGQAWFVYGGTVIVGSKCRSV